MLIMTTFNSSLVNGEQKQITDNLQYSPESFPYAPGDGTCSHKDAEAEPFCITSKMTILVVAILFSLLGTAIYLVSLLVICSSKRIKDSPTFPFILSMIICNFLYYSTCVPILGIKLHSPLYLPDWICRIYPLVLYSSLLIYLFLLAALTLNNIIVMYNLDIARKMFTKRCDYFIVTLCWIVPVAVILPAIFGLYGRVELSKDEAIYRCFIVDDESNHNSSHVLFNGLFPLCFILLVFCFALACYKFKTFSEEESFNAKKTLLLKTLAALTFFFMVSTMPGGVIFQVDKCIKMPYWHIASYIIHFVFSLADPFIFYMGCSMYKDAFHQLLSHMKPQKLEEDFVAPLPEQNRLDLFSRGDTVGPDENDPASIHSNYRQNTNQVNILPAASAKQTYSQYDQEAYPKEFLSQGDLLASEVKNETIDSGIHFP